MNLHCIIVDDEPLAMDVLEDHIQKHPGLVLRKKCSSALEATDYLRHHAIELIFLDIMMPRSTGIEFLASLEASPMVIFTTAHREYAVDGYDFNIVDFLLKPISFERFGKAVDKAIHHKEQQLSQVKTENKDDQELFIRSGIKMVRLVIGDICYIEGMKDYLKLHTKKEKVIVVKKTMKSIERQLAKYRFIRIHKSFLVSARHIRTAMNDKVEVGNSSLPIGRNYREHVKSFLRENLFDE